MKPEVRNVLTRLQEHCQQQVSAYQVRIDALKERDETDACIAKHCRDMAVWQERVEALSEALAEE